MIWDSHYWKKDLLRDADILLRWANKKCTERQAVLFEKKIFINTYSMRKLLEAKKIDFNLSGWNKKVERYPIKSSEVVPNLLNWYQIEKFYNFKKLEHEGTSLKNLFDWIVHSYIFMLEYNDMGYVEGFLFTSDHKKRECLYRLGLKEFISILRCVGGSDIVERELKYDGKKIDYKIINSKYSYSCPREP